MANIISHTSTAESITVVFNGKTYVVRAGSPNFLGLRKALRDQDWDKVPGYLTVVSSITQWSNAKFQITESGQVTFEGQDVPYEFGKRIVKMATDGEDPTPLFRFYERLQQNPSKRSVDQLWPFLSKVSIPITKDGCFLAYKGVNSDFMDRHTGTISNKPGTVVKLPRNSVSDDPREACHFGLHVGAHSYASSFAGSNGQLVICKVDPQHVVCVPYDSSQEKMRVCQYTVLGIDGQDLPDTIFDEDEEQVPEPTEPVVEKTEVKKVMSKKGKPSATVITKTRPDIKAFEKFEKLDTGGLMDKSIDELRKYAAHALQIVGASKIPGGKTALVKKILKARG